MALQLLASNSAHMHKILGLGPIQKPASSPLLPLKVWSQDQPRPKMGQEVGPKQVKMAANSDLFARVRASVGTNFDPSHTNAATSPSLRVSVK